MRPNIFISVCFVYVGERFFVRRPTLFMQYISGLIQEKTSKILTEVEIRMYSWYDISKKKIGGT